jgi:hypothetical protein
MHFQTYAYFPVSLAVTLNLRAPKPAILPRDVAARWTPVPEAPVNEHSYPCLREIEIGIALHTSRTHTPPDYALPDKAQAQPPLGGTIILSPDRLHRPRMLGSRPREVSVTQEGSQRSFHVLDPLVVEGRHRRGEPE